MSTVPPVPRLSSQNVLAWVDGLARVDRAACDVERIEQIAALERLKSAAAAAQAVLTADFAASQRTAQVVSGVPAARFGQGVAAQVALARRESPYRGSQHAGLAQALVTELPTTLAALRSGDISEWRATIVARETACLDPADRRSADAELGPRLQRWGTGRPRLPRDGLPTGWTRPRSWRAPAAPTPSGGSACARRRTPCPG